MTQAMGDGFAASLGVQRAADPCDRTNNGLPIGVFDSGVGGLTVVAALMRHLPQESILYLGDTARLPYGTKSPQTVQRYTHRNIDFLLRRGVKAVVVACNTASALAPEVFDAELPIWGVVEPGARTAAAIGTARVGIIATESTVRSDAYGLALRRLRPELEVLSQPCPLFVPLVEEGWGEDPIAEQIARRYLEPLLTAHIDTLVLGCTHYPLLVPILRQILGESVQLVDSGEAVSQQVATELHQLGLAASHGTPHYRLCVTDASERFQRIARDLLVHALPVAPELTLEWVEL